MEFDHHLIFLAYEIHSVTTMAYQFFAKAHQSNKGSPTTPLSSPHPSSSSSSSSSKPSRLSKPVPSMMVPRSSNPTSTSIAAQLKAPPPSTDLSFQPPAFPHSIAPGYQTPHPHVTIEPVSTGHIPSLTRITGLLLPTRYPNSFYTAIITDPVIASVSRVAVYHDHPAESAPLSTSTNTSTDKVIGGIRCRLERLAPTLADHQGSHQEPTNLYIQTLHLLSPYRGSGIAASLLHSLLFNSSSNSKLSASDPPHKYQLSDLVKHYNIRSVTAHVHETNEDGLEWYIARGFEVQDGIVENYYRRLKPSGAKIVKLVLDWSGADTADPGQTRPGLAQAEIPENDDDWEKVEAEDEDDQDDDGVQSLSASKTFDDDDRASRKRKADDEPQK